MLQKTKGEGNLVIYGVGETADIAFEYFTHDTEYKVVAFVVDDKFKESDSYRGRPLISLSELQTKYPPNKCSVFVAMAASKLNRIRAKSYFKVKAMGYTCPSYISSKSFVWHNVVIGENCMIFEGNVIQHGVRIGNDVILWSGNHVGHQTSIGDHCFVSSHCVISGFCKIGNFCYLGVNCTFRDEFVLADDCMVAMGATMLNETTPGKIYQGTPAKANDKKSSYQLFGVNPDEMAIS